MLFLEKNVRIKKVCIGYNVYYKDKLIFTQLYIPGESETYTFLYIIHILIKLGLVRIK
mgnify:CR=1 FL=1